MHTMRSTNEEQEVHSGSLDHEQHEMSEHREPANADVDETIPRLTGDSACCRRRIRLASGETSGSHVNRV